MNLRKLILSALWCLGWVLTIHLNPANAQTTNCKAFDFNLVPTYRTGQNTFANTSGDYNGDGYLDIAVINAEIRTVSVLFGDGAGGFAPSQIYQTEINPWSITSGDLNSDGKSDLIAGSFYENKIAVLLNNGQGRFQAPIIITPSNSSGQFYDLKAADFNGDGNIDVVALALQENKQLKILLGNGQGNLTLTSTLILGGRDSEIEVGFLNGDNLPDIIASSGDGFGSRSVKIVAGQQNGVFSVAHSFYINEKAVGIKIADLNEDGANDLAIAFEDQTTPTTHLLQPWFNNGNGTFFGGTRLDIPYYLSPSDITIGDFNGDGKKDLALPVGGSLVMVTHGIGNGNFQSPSYWVTPSATYSLLTGDLNQDNKPDLVGIQGGSFSNNSISVLINNNNNGFKAPKPVLWGMSNLNAADLNNDGLKDFVSSYSTEFNSTSDVVIALNDGNQGLLPDRGRTTPAALRAIKVGDFNGDGNQDAVTAHSFSARQLAVFLGDGTGDVGEPIATSINVPFENIIVGNFNGDGKDDVFAIDTASRGYSFLSNGNGTFTLAPNFPVTLQGSLLKLEKGDFNRDNNLDLIISNSGVVNLWLGNGAGQFTLSANTIPSLGDVVAGDFNGDGNLDLAGFAEGGIKGILGNGDGSFGESFIRPISVTGRNLISADFNADGFSDLAFRIELGNTDNLVIVPSGGQTPSWNSPLLYSIGGLSGYTGALFAADYNSDNKPDIGYSTGITRGVIYNTSGQKPCVSINDVTITEGDSGSTTALFSINLSAPAAQPVSVNFSLEGRSATIGTDLQNVSGRLVIPEGQTSVNINITVNGDLFDEFDEDFAVNLSSSTNASILKSVGTGTIIDNDPEPLLTVTDISQIEPTFSQGFVFRVNLSAPSGKPISFRYATADGTATAGNDYSSVNTTWNIQPGISTADLLVIVNGDNTHERDETFFLNVSTPVNVTLSDAQGQGTIINNDPIPTLNISAGSVTEGDTGLIARTVNLQLSNPTYLPVTVNVLTNDGTALSGRDYIASDTPVVIPAEQQNVQSNIQIIGDTINESNETFFVNIYNVVNATINTTQAQFLIIDDEFVANDFDRDGKTDVAVFRPSDSKWYFLFSSNNNFSATQYGLGTDLPVSGDYNGDGRTDIAVFRPSSGGWYTTVPNRSQIWGSNGDLPVHGDYDNDGRIDVAVFRPSTSTWYIQLSSNNSFKFVQFGLETDKPVPADYDGDGKTDIAVFRPENGTWYILRSSDNGFVGLQFGIAADKPVAADYDGDGRADIAVFRDGNWYVSRSSDNGFMAFQWGTAGDKPVPGNYDGDDKSDFAVYRDGIWYIWQSSTSSYIEKRFGLADDIPLPFVSNN